MNSSKPVVAYFSAEYAIADDLPIYAGGLGILAADLVLEAGNGDTPFYAVGLVYHQAFTGEDPDQRTMIQRLEANGFNLATDSQGRRHQIGIRVGGRDVQVQAWIRSWGPSTLILLDTHIEGNAEIDQAICDRLYAKDLDLQFAQEICLGFGGVRMLRALEVEPDIYHLNEGHAALAGLALALRQVKKQGIGLLESVDQVKARIVGTKHTILAGAGLLLSWDIVERQLGALLSEYNAPLNDLRQIAEKHNGDYSDTKLLLALSGRASGVSKIHVAAEKHEHPSSSLIPITNGVSASRWLSPNWGSEWRTQSDQTIWETHRENRLQLLELVKTETGTVLDPETLTVVWARRMTAYKQPGLLVKDLDRLAELTGHTKYPIQFIVAGMANPADAVGVELMNKVIAASKMPSLAARFAYLPHYNPATARKLVQGADLWLNTPIRGYEACGTSGMKASMNGVVQFSTSDGWIDEIEASEIGWILPEGADAEVLYTNLDENISPLFYNLSDGLPTEWIKLMKANMQLASTQFSAERMLSDYYRQLYQSVGESQ